MFDTDEEIRNHALNMWGNYIESGSVTLSRNDCIKQGEVNYIKSLSDEQLALVARIRQLAKDELKR